MVGWIKKYYQKFIRAIAILVFAGSIVFIIAQNISCHIIDKNLYIYPNYMFENVDRSLIIATIVSVIFALLFTVSMFLDFKSKRPFFKIARYVGYLISVTCILVFGLLLAVAVRYNSHTVDLDNYLKFDKYLDSSEIATFFPESEYLSESVIHSGTDASYSYTLSLPLFVEKCEFEITLRLDYASSDEFKKIKNDLMNAKLGISESDDEIVYITVKDAICTEEDVNLVSYYYIEIDSANNSIMFSAEQYYGETQ